MSTAVAVSSHSTAAGKHRVVLVDDEPAVTLSWGKILQREGYDVVACQDAASALDAIGKGCDVVMTDQHMPGMTGIELISTVRQSCPVNPRFVMLTASHSSSTVLAALRAGASCVLTKPCPPLLVLNAIGRLCRAEELGSLARSSDHEVFLPESPANPRELAD